MTMSRIALLVIALATATPALANPVNPAYRYSGTHAGGPADALLSPTGGRPGRIRHPYSNPGDRYSRTHAGRAAGAPVRGGRVAPVDPALLAPSRGGGVGRPGWGGGRYVPV